MAGIYASILFLNSKCIFISCICLSGFMFGTNVLDKDGISAAVVMAEMAAYLSRQGLTLTEQLNNLYKRYASLVIHVEGFYIYEQKNCII